ncbi:proton-conducting transporter membrane subunit [Buchnera aphidicola]|uniref:NADH:quinone oxidoreductase/Mrp antiporter transmembrane domain-containing protein n=1 Tax=Buchnera aphidicola (Therioaphis trifolii) TaxID=1241884 RepID=A0A4D6YAZ1_9GAMM|nr:proton-conducting transporter membrane subunit [Buchnera aphidicola]QCI27126.1 hypothetical protein D9V81_00630 [Buchnera aphidicola (Therioaphis trifolii)]
MFILNPKVMILIPFLILITSIICIILSIIFKRNHLFSFYISFFSLIFILLSFFFIYKYIPIYFSTLLCINFYSIIYLYIIIFSSIFTIFINYFYLQKYFFYQEEFYLLILSSIIGAITVIEANHIFIILFGIELMSFPILGLMLYSLKKHTNIRIILKYLILSSIVTIFSFLGISLIYLICGNLNLNNIKISFLINDIQNNKILLIGLGLLLISLFFKLSLFPFHFWISDIYKNISPFLLMYSTTVIKVATFSVLMKIFMYIPYEKSKVLYLIIELISISSIIFGSFMTVFQNNIKKLFGYSSIVHMGYILITLFSINNYHFNNSIALIYLINYTISNIGIFSLLSLLLLLDHNTNFNLNNLFVYNFVLWKKIIFHISVFIIIFSFLSIPFTFGFISKFCIFFIILYAKLWMILYAILINSGFSIYYYLKIILNLYRNNLSKNISNKKSYTVIQIFIFLISIIILFIGIYPKIIFDFFKIKI